MNGEEHPVRLILEDDLRRSRLTVFFRVLLALPPLLWLCVWAVAAYLAIIVMWIAALVTGSPPAALYRFVERFVRYMARVAGYVQLICEPFPGFSGREGGYPLDLTVPGPQPQRRVITAFRLILAIPALLFANAFGRVVSTFAILVWFYALATGRTHRGLRDVGAYSLRYEAQTWAYLVLLTERYPSLTPIPGKPEFEASLRRGPI